MKQLPSRLRRLDDALADLPLDEPMLLTELDGFLTGILLSPDPIVPAEWLTVVWGSDEGGIAPFDDPLDVQWFADAVIARQNEIARDLGRGKPQPIFDVDERNGDVLWELWIDGFAAAMEMRPESWAAVADGNDPDAAAALARVSMLIAVARNESPLDSVQINALQDRAPAELIEAILQLHAASPRDGGTPSAAPIGVPPAKVGRNEPCRCGSGKKSKRCCG
jgi:uncharacterized protein